MTITATASEISYAGDGVSLAFAIPFVFDTAADLKVTTTIAGVITVITTGFSVSGGGGATGTLTFLAAPAVGTTISIFDDPAITQPTDYVNNDAFPAESHERALDRVTRIAKRTSQRISRSLRFPDGDASTDGTLADVATRKGKYPFFNAVTGVLEYALTIATTALTQSLFDASVRASVDIDTQGVVPGGRVTLTTGVAVTTADVAGATTIRYTPHVHDRIKLYNGTIWKWYTFTELSQTLADATKSPAATAASKNYDMLVWDDAGTVRCTRGPLWDTGGGSNTLRGTGAGSTELEFFGGRWVNKFAITNGPAARCGLYVGSIGTDASNQVNDVGTGTPKRQVWNMYNRRSRGLLRLDPAGSWTYNANAWRQANANASNQVEVLIGLVEDTVTAQVLGAVADNVAAVTAAVGIGIDSTTVDSSSLQAGAVTAVGAVPSAVTATYQGYPGLGRHVLAWLENGFGNGGTMTWYGTALGGKLGIAAQVMA